MEEEEWPRRELRKEVERLRREGQELSGATYTSFFRYAADPDDFAAWATNELGLDLSELIEPF